MRSVLIPLTFAAMLGLGALQKPEVHAVAASLPLLDQAEAAELAEELADATEKQKICYGWDVTVDAQDGSVGGRDVGSNLGAGIPADTAPSCSQYAIFAATITYTDEWSEAEDSATFTVRSNLPGAALDIGDYVTERALLGELEDVAVIDATLTLPMLVADKGLAPYPDPASPATTPPPADAFPTDPPRSDFLRVWWPGLLLAAVSIFGGSGFLLSAFLEGRNR